MLLDFIAVNREEIIRRCRAKTVARSGPLVSTAAIDHGVPMFLGQLVQELSPGSSNADAIGQSAVKHGHHLLHQGFTIGEVVHEYGDICQSVTDLAVELVAPISADDFRTLNRCLDDAIAGAVTEYGRERAASIDIENTGQSERVDVLAHKLKKSIQSVDVALAAIKSGTVGFAGSTGSVLDRSVQNAHDLIDRLLDAHAVGPPTT